MSDVHSLKRQTKFYLEKLNFFKVLFKNAKSFHTKTITCSFHCRCFKKQRGGAIMFRCVHLSVLFTKYLELLKRLRIFRGTFRKEIFGYCLQHIYCWGQPDSRWLSKLVDHGLHKTDTLVTFINTELKFAVLVAESNSFDIF